MRFAVLVLAALVSAGCAPRTPVAVAPPTRAEIWAEAQKIAGRYRIEPTFVYALVAAESNFNPSARNGEARGLMQIKPSAWKTVSREPYEPTVWDWRANLRVGTEYLAWCRHTLHKNQKFSYPRLLASFHYGLDAVERSGWDVDDFEVPSNPVYEQLWQGNLSPVPPPR